MIPANLDAVHRIILMSEQRPVDFDQIYDEYLASACKTKSLDDESFQKRSLRGAVCEYIDGNDISSFILDLYDILNREYLAFSKKANSYRGLMNLIKSTVNKGDEPDSGYIMLHLRALTETNIGDVN